MAPSGGAHAVLFPPVLESAVGVADRTIRLTWRYRREDLTNFMFRRKNITLNRTEEFEVLVSPGSTTHVHDDIGRSYRDHRKEPILDPETSYQYVVGAVHPPGDPEAVGVYWNDDQPVTGTTPNTPFEPTFEGTLRYDEGGWQGRTLVQRIEADALSKSGTQVKLTLRASSVGPAGGTYIQSIYISKPDPVGHPYDSGDDLTQVSPKLLLPADEAVTLSFIRYHLDEGSPLLIAVEFIEPAGIKYRLVKTRFGGFFGGIFGILPIGVAYWHTGLEAGLRNRSVNYESANRIYLVEKIEVR